MTCKQEDIDQLAAYAAEQRASFQTLLTNHCRDLVSDRDYYETFKAAFYKDTKLVEEVSSLRLNFTVNASPAAAAIKATLNALLSTVDDEHQSHICNLLKAEVVYHERDSRHAKKRHNGPN